MVEWLIGYFITSSALLTLCFQREACSWGENGFHGGVWLKKLNNILYFGGAS